MQSKRLSKGVSKVWKAKSTKRKTIASRRNASSLCKDLERETLLLDLHRKAPDLSDTELYNYTLDQAVRLTESTFGFFYLVSENQQHAVLADWSCAPLRNCSAVSDNHFSLDRAENWMDCVRLKQPVLCNDYPHSPNQKGLPESRTPLHRFMSIPVILDNEVRFILGVGNKRGKYDEHDVTQTQLVAHELQTILMHREDREAHRTSERKYRAFIDAIQMAVVVHGKDTRILAVNPMAERLLGLPEAQLLGRKATDPGWDFLKENGARMRADEYPVSQALSLQKPIRNLVAGIPRPDGKGTRWAMVNAACLRDEHGEISEVVVSFVDMTDRKHAEAELQRTHELMQTIIEAAPVAIVGIDLEGKVRDVWNPAAEKMFGSSAREAMGKYIPGMPVDTEERLRTLGERTRSGSSVNGVEVSMQRPDGTPLDYNVYASPLHDVEGRISGNVAVLVDITERKKAEEALWESTQRLKLVLDNMPAFVFWKDRNSVYQGCNVLFAANAGLKPAEIAGRTDCDLPWKDTEAAGYRADDAAVMKSGIPKINYEETQTTADGRLTAVRTSKVPLRNPEGDIIGVLGTFEDITERKRAEMELIDAHKEAERLLLFNEALLSAIPTPVFYKDREGKYLGCNHAFSEVMGKTTEDIKGKTVFDIWPSEHALEYHRKDLELMANPVRQTYEFAVRDKNGVNRPVIYVKDVFRDENGEIAGIVGAFLDITERKRAENEALTLNQELEKRVDQRTAQLEAANKELEAFAYSVSHDLRTPLRSIDGFGQILMEEHASQLDENGKDYLHRVRQGAQRMGQLIDDLLDLSRVSRAEMTVQQVNLSQMAQRIAGDLRDSDPQRHVNFAVAEGIEARGDGRLLRIVLENLLGNAWKYTSKHPTALIEFGQMQTDKRNVLFVRDDGAGFDSQFVHKLFGVFQRLHKTSDFPGTGIGLATVQRIVHKHGGDIWVKGEVEKGATFYFTLP